MRTLLPFLLLAACAAEPAPEKSVYAGAGRDRLCIDGNRAGFITYGTRNVNCSVRGRVERAGNRLTIIPAGDQDCRIQAEFADGSIRLGQRDAACSYYCGPDADYSGRAFARSGDNPRSATDLAGDPLC